MIADRFFLLVTAMIADALVGDPDSIWARTGHPVSWFGKLIATLDRRLNQDHAPPSTRRNAGIVGVVVLVVVAGAIGLALEWLFARIPYGWLLTIAVAAILLAGRSLFDHVAAVARALPDLAAARVAISRIVGRDPESLDEHGVSRAAIETTAENFSDGVVAPALWFLLLGLPGILVYKAVNTADSMIGHRTRRHEAFGWAAAKLDDVLNWPAARLSGVLIAVVAPLAGGRTDVALKTMFRDAAKHRSVNAGWPEAAMAGALGLALAGPRTYAGVVVEDSFLNAEGRREANAHDIGQALRLLLGAWLALLVVVELLGFGLKQLA